MRNVRWLAIGLVVCSLAATSGQDAAETVTLKIKVTDKHGQPVPEAQVYLLDLKRRAPDGGPLKTDADGVLEIPDLPAGQVRLNIHADGFVDAISQQVIIGGNQPVREVSFTLEGACQLFGRVVIGPEKLPPPTDSVIVGWRTPGKQMGARLKKLYGDGEFSLPAWEFGRRALAARVEGYSWAIREVELEPDGLIDGLEFVLEEPSGSLAGKVVGPDGQPVEQVCIALIREDVVEAQSDTVWSFPVFWHADNKVDETRTDEAGTFELQDVPAGRYYLAAGEPERQRHRGHVGPVEVRPGAATTGLTIEYGMGAAQGGAIFVGTLLDPGHKPLPNHEFTYSAMAYVWDEAGKTWPGHGSAATARSDAEGRFAVPSEYRCERGSLGVWGDGVLPVAVMPVEPDDRGVIDVDSVPKRAVSGAVYRGPERAPIPGAELMLVGRAEKQPGAQSANVRADPDGSFGPVLLDSRAMQVLIFKGGLDSAGTSRAEVPLPAGPGPADIEVVFPALGSATGIVTQDGEPLGIPVVVRAGGTWQAHPPSSYGAPPLHGPQAVVAAGDTEWRIDDLEPGSRVFQVEGTGLLFAPGAQVEVKPAETARVRIEVPKAAPVAGRVIGTDGKVPSRIDFGMCPGWMTPPGWVEFPVGADGRFSFENMPVTRMRFSVRGQGCAGESHDVDVPEEGLPNLEFKLKPAK